MKCVLALSIRQFTSGQHTGPDGKGEGGVKGRRFAAGETAAQGHGQRGHDRRSWPLRGSPEQRSGPAGRGQPLAASWRSTY